MLAEALIEQYLQTRQAQLVSALHSAAADDTTEIIETPGAGARLVVVGGVVTADAAGTSQWFEVDETGPALSGLVTIALGRPFTLGPWVLPENTPLACETVTCAVNGTIAYVIAPV